MWWARPGELVRVQSIMRMLKWELSSFGGGSRHQKLRGELFWKRWRQSDPARGEAMQRPTGKAPWEQSAKRQLRPVSQKREEEKSAGEKLPQKSWVIKWTPQWQKWATSLQYSPHPREWAIATVVGCAPELGGKNLLLDPLKAPLEIIPRTQFWIH